MLPMGSVGIDIVCANRGKPYQRFPRRGNTRKRLEMLVARIVYDPTPAQGAEINE
jgi:hypothetical protein